MRPTLLLTITLLLIIPVLFLRPAQTREQEQHCETGLPNLADYPPAGPSCKKKVKLAPWHGQPDIGNTNPVLTRCRLSFAICGGVTKCYQSEGRIAGAGFCDDFSAMYEALLNREICCDDSSAEKSDNEKPYCGDCQISQGNACVADNTKNGKACDKGGHCGSCNNGTCEPVKTEVSRPSLAETKSMGIPRPKPGVSPAFTYQANTVTGSNAATYSTSDSNANPNAGDIKAPTITGAPQPGGLAELSVSYTCQAGDTVTKKFQVATFGLSCYMITDENDFIRPAPPPTPTPTPDPAASPTPTSSPTPAPSPTLNCSSYRIGDTRYTGVTTNPTGLPPGDYCTAFLADVRLQGSGLSRNGTKVHYVSGTNPNWVFEVVDEFTGADNTALIPNGSVARDRSIVPRSTRVKLQSGDFVANDTGGAIIGYRLDVFGGTGRAACASFQNRIEVGACTPGTATCPELKSPIP